MIKIAIIGPSFFSYQKTIQDEFKRRNMKSDFYDERHSKNIIVKIIYRLGLGWIIKKQKNNHLRIITDSIIRKGYTDVILISPEVIEKKDILYLKGNGIRIHLYLWDSIKNKKKCLTYFDDVDTRSSFDPVDCNNYGMNFIHLFADNSFSEFYHHIDKLGRSTDIFFCGTLHSNRSSYLYKLQKNAKDLQLKTVFLTFYHSKFLFFIKSLAYPANLFFSNKVSTIPFSINEIADNMFNSKFVFDIPHEKQNGLPARTFEALRSGACLIIFNKDIHTLPTCFQKRIIVIKKIKELREIDLKGKENEPLNEKQDYYLSVGRFVDDILGTMGYTEEMSSELRCCLL